MAKLLIQESSGIREFELVDEEVRIGRELDNTLRLADPSISRHHAVLRRTASGYEIQDLGSSNGLLVNGARVQASPLNDSDRVTLGQLHMTFADPKAAAAPQAEAPAQESFSPLGTVRIDPSEMAKLHTAKAAAEASVPATPAAPAPAPSTTMPRPPSSVFGTQPGVALPGGAATLKAPAGAPLAPEENPAPGFLQAWLPPVPDDAEPVMLDGAPERGDFVTRLLAHLIDAIPLIAISVIFYVLTFVLNMIPGVGGVISAGIGLVIMAVQAVLNLAYAFFFLPWCWTKFGATPGKKIMKLRVVPEDDATGRIDFGTALMRMVGHFVNGLVCSLPYLMILGADRKGLQDMLSKSLVIKVDR